jgi:predicted dehydrogenase
MTVRVGIFGTSWWADAMYLPPMQTHPEADVVAVCGRREQPAADFADRWSIPNHFTDPSKMLRECELDAVVIATANDSHHGLAVASLNAGLHVLCEKPLALNVEQAEAMTRLAAETGAITLVPFTYHYMPVNRWVRRLVADGYVGRPLHINLRYYTAFGFDTAYSWRFDDDVAGSGIIGDLGSHWIHLARWLLGETETSVSAVTSRFVDRDPRPDGSDYVPTEDSAVLTVRYESGAYGVIQTSAVCWEGSTFGQNHQLEIHGDEGTIHARCDWDTIQQVTGMKKGDRTGLRELPIPDHIWGSVRRDLVHDTYRDVFRNTEAMTRGWITAISQDREIQPDFAEGLAVQRVIEAALESAASGGCPVSLV